MEKLKYAISDFGLMTAAESQTTTLTRTNVGGGTVLYAAPECVSNFRKATPLSDIYSFGAILHDIFVATDRIPYSELTGPAPIGSIIEKATKTNTLRRYQSVADVRADLYEALNAGDLKFSSDEEKEIVELLQENNELSDDQWDRIFMFLEDNEDDRMALGPVFRYLNNDHINQITDTAPELLSALGKLFCFYVQNGVFDFDYCDVLASKVERFFLCGGTDLKAMAIIALLTMGTSHNRWVVEHKFLRLAGADLPEEVAQRIKIEIDIQGLNFERLVSHVERSIDTSRNHLHPVLQGILMGA